MKAVISSGDRLQEQQQEPTLTSPLATLPMAAGQVDDAFWSPRLRILRAVTLPSQEEQCERSGRIDNFRRAAGRPALPFRGRFYNDSDVYKWLEAACYALAWQPDSALESRVDALIEVIAAAQQPNGYLNTYFSHERAGERWHDLAQLHEMYCAGHLIEAAVAHHGATGKTRLLQVAVRLADHLCNVFGPAARAGTDGHEEIELALVALYRETGQRRYLDQAAFFLDQRGQTPPLLGGNPYLQDHQPVREQRDVVGHAVRATYLACGMLDVAMETGDRGLWDAAAALWESAFHRKAYLTGGLGARYEGEAFGEDYELPNARAYAETCAAIGGFLWSWRLLRGSGDARYADAMETALYNGIISGISLSGAEYFYQNPLADRGGHRRRPWFDTACCPPNLARLLLSLPRYLYSAGPDTLWVHLYAAGHVTATLAGEPLRVRIATRYPWDYGIQLIVERAPAQPCSLALRLPGWCEQPQFSINGEPAAGEPRPGTYAMLHRAWKVGDIVELQLPMPVRRIAGHPRVLAVTGRVALARGPLVYCVEAVDHPGSDPYDLAVPPDVAFETRFAPDLLGGVVTVHADAVAISPDRWDGDLYRPLNDQPARAPRLAALTAIPYYAWANRERGPMQVWLRQAGRP